MNRIRKQTRKFLRYLVLSAITLILLFPLIFMVTNSFMDEKEVTSTYAAIQGQEEKSDPGYVKVKLIPEQAGFSQYYRILLRDPTFLVMFWNSVILTLPIILGQILVSALGAYAFTNIRFPFRNQIFFLLIIVMLMPYQVTLVSNYIILKNLNLVGSYLSIILPGMFSPFGVFLLSQFMRSIPGEYSESAKIDGAGHFIVFSKIVLPQCKAGVASLAILGFIDNWNMVEQPLIFLKDEFKYPMSIFLSKINSGQLGIAFACGVIYMIPPILIYLFGEEHLVKGIQLAGLR